MDAQSHDLHQDLVARSGIRGVWRDNIGRERRLAEEHPEWKIRRTWAEGASRGDVTYEATDGVITLRSRDLGVLLDQVERALTELT